MSKVSKSNKKPVRTLKKVEKVDYHKRPEWSYSDLRKIPEEGIEYAIAAKLGIIPFVHTPAMAFGTMLHQLSFGGDEQFFTPAMGGFSDYKTTAAREWRDKQLAEGKIQISNDEYSNVRLAVEERVLKHPYVQQWLLGEGWQHEVEMYATLDGLPMRGKADGLKVYEEDGRKKIQITDLKTTSFFKDFARKAYYENYHLQAAVYTWLAHAVYEVPTTDIEYRFCVVENKFPYRVKYAKMSSEAMEAGEILLSRCMEAVKGWGDQEPNFLITEVEEIGDWSL